MSTSFFNQYLDIEAWLEKYRIENYFIRDNFTVDVDGHVFLIAKRLSSLPVQFGIVTGEFNCSSNFLTSLKGAPLYVKGAFDCNRNFLTNLKSAPLEVGSSFAADHNKLTSLEGITPNLNHIVDLRDNMITSLEGLSVDIKNLYISNNPITHFDTLFDMAHLESLVISKYNESGYFSSRDKLEIQAFIESTQIIYEQDKLFSLIDKPTHLANKTIKI